MSYTSWMEAVKSGGSRKEPTAADKAKEAGLVSIGGNAWAKEKGGPTVAKTVGDKLMKVDDGEKPEKEPEAQPKKEPAPSKSTGKVLDSVSKQNMKKVRGGYEKQGKEQIAQRI